MAAHPGVGNSGYWHWEIGPPGGPWDMSKRKHPVKRSIALHFHLLL